jgi:hypothetical protein
MSPVLQNEFVGYSRSNLSATVKETILYTYSTRETTDAPVLTRGSLVIGPIHEDTESRNCSHFCMTPLPWQHQKKLSKTTDLHRHYVVRFVKIISCEYNII